VYYEEFSDIEGIEHRFRIEREKHQLARNCSREHGFNYGSFDCVSITQRYFAVQRFMLHFIGQDFL
jgi:hypothetical protein